MKRILLMIFLLSSASLHAQKSLDESVSDLATQITTSAARQEKQRIAVLPFLDTDGQPTVLGTYLAEELVTRLFQLGDFKIVERPLLERSGTIDPAAAKKIGRTAGVDAIVTGSITELATHVAVNCRLIDALTGEVFGAAQAKIAKDENVTKIMNTALPSGSGSPAATQPGHQTSKAIATKDIGSLRVTLKSVLKAGDGARWTFTFENRESRKPIVVAVNAIGLHDGERQAGLSFGSASKRVPLRSSVVDDRGGAWGLSSAGITGIGFVRAGVHGRRGQEAYDPMEIGKLLRLRDELGRDRDDPSDGETRQATSRGEGGSNVTFGGGRITSPVQFFRNRGNQFVSGTTTVIEPAQSTTVSMDFHPERGGSPSAPGPITFHFNSEIVIGVGDSRRSYTLHNLTFDRVSLPSF